MLAGTSRFRDRGVSSARSPAASLQRIKSESSSRNRLRYPDRFSAAVEHELRNSDFDAKTISVGIDAGYDSNEI